MGVLASAVVIALVYSFVVLLPEPGPSGGSGSGGTATPATYEDSCRQWNADHPEQYTDPETCAADAEEMAEDLADYLAQ